MSRGIAVLVMLGWTWIVVACVALIIAASAAALTLYESRREGGCKHVRRNA